MLSDRRHITITIPLWNDLVDESKLVYLPKTSLCSFHALHSSEFHFNLLFHCLLSMFVYFVDSYFIYCERLNSCRESDWTKGLQQQWVSKNKRRMITRKIEMDRGKKEWIETLMMMSAENLIFSFHLYSFFGCDLLSQIFLIFFLHNLDVHHKWLLSVNFLIKRIFLRIKIYVSLRIDRQGMKIQKIKNIIFIDLKSKNIYNFYPAKDSNLSIFIHATKTPQQKKIKLIKLSQFIHIAIPWLNMIHHLGSHKQISSLPLKQPKNNIFWNVLHQDKQQFQLPISINWPLRFL